MSESLHLGPPCALRLRVYPTSKQERLGGQWFYLSHKFRNEVVAFLTTRRQTRTAWIKQHPVLARDGISEELSGSDSSAASKWLTGRLESARASIALESGVRAPKNTLTTVVHHLSSGEIQEIEDAWLLGLPRTILDQVIQDLKKTLDKAIGDRKAKKRNPAGFPTFRKWQHTRSIRFQVNPDKHADLKSHWAAGEVFIPGMGRLKFKDTLDLPATPPKMMTLSRNAAGQWHVSFLCASEENPIARKKPKASTSRSLPLNDQGLPRTTAIDLSLPSLGVDQDGKALGRTRYLKRCKARMTRLSRQLSRKTKGSRRWQKQARILGKAHVRVANLRETGLREAAQAVVKDSAIVCLEDFSLAFMLQNRCLSASTHDAGLGRLRTLIEQEAAKYGHLVLWCGRFDASSKTCSACGWVYKNLTLKERTWTCAGCSAFHDRDQNAAVNIRVMALQKAIMDFSSASEIGATGLSSHRMRLHPDLEASIARGGLTALLEFYSRESRPVAEMPVDSRTCETRFSPEHLSEPVGNGI